MPKIKTIGTIHDTLTGYDFEVDTALSPLKAIRFKCLECCCNNAAEVKRCHITDCTLWPFRMGKNPNRAGIGSKNMAFLRSRLGSRSDPATISPRVGVE